MELFFPAQTPTDQTGCQIQVFQNIGLTLCMPKSWVVRLTEGSKKLQLGKLVIQSPDFDEIADQTPEGLPSISIKNGIQLSITASRLTAASNIATFSALKSFWEINRAGHAISRQEERAVGGLPGLYHFLASPKEGNQIDIHVLKMPLLYDINFYYNGTKTPLGEDIFREILDSVTFQNIDPLTTVSDQIRVTAIPELPAPPSKPITILVTTNFEISSQSELPSIIRRSQSGTAGPATTIGTATPVMASDSAALRDAREFSFTWKNPDYASVLVALVVKNDGQIYESLPLPLSTATKAPGTKPLQPATSAGDLLPGIWP
jgi:hypothetical protein